MEFIIFTDETKKSNYLKQVLESTFTCQVTLVNNYENYLSCLSEKNYALNIYSSNHEFKAEDVLKIKHNLYKTRNLFVHKDSENKFINLKDDISLKIVFQKDPEDIQETFKNITSLFNLNNESKDLDQVDYYPVRLEYLLKMLVAPSDIYIKLSDSKYLKMIKKDSFLSSKDFENLIRREVKSLFIHHADFESFLTSFKIEEVENKFDSMVYAQEIFHYFSSKIGLNEKAINSANKAINVLFDYMSEEPVLKKMWDNLMKKKSPMAEHSLMVGYLSAAILNYTKFNSDSNTIKLTLASVLHDAVIPSEDKFLFELNSFDFDKHSKREIDRFKEHVIKSVDVLEKFDNAPLDVDKILLNHHEKYDGSGYPRGLTGNKIPFLSAVFIVAHEFVIELMNTGFEANKVKAYLDQKSVEYKDGSFKDAIDALLKTV